MAGSEYLTMAVLADLWQAWMRCEQEGRGRPIRVTTFGLGPWSNSMGLSAWLLVVRWCEEGRAAAVAIDARPGRCPVFTLLKVMVKAGEVYHPLEPTTGTAIRD